MHNQLLDSTSQVEFMTELVHSHTELAGDILQIGAATWAIHGWIPIDGDVLVAEYDSLASAKAALAQVPLNWDADHADRDVAPAGPERQAGVPSYFLGRSSATWRAALTPPTALRTSRP